MKQIIILMSLVLSATLFPMMDDCALAKLDRYIVDCKVETKATQLKNPTENIYKKKVGRWHLSEGIGNKPNGAGDKIAVASYHSGHNGQLVGNMMMGGHYKNYYLKVFSYCGKEFLYDLECLQERIDLIKFKDNIFKAYYYNGWGCSFDTVQKWNLNAGKNFIEKLTEGQKNLIQKFYKTKGKGLSRSDYYHYFSLPKEVKDWLAKEGISLPKSAWESAKQLNLIK